MHLTLPCVPRFIRYIWSQWIRPLALPLLLIATAKSALADINFVPSGSMRPTIVEGDVVFVNKLAYNLRVPFTTVSVAHWADPARGDIIVCFSPDDNTRLVKRLVAVPGDTVELRDGVLYLNGERSTYRILPGEVFDFSALERAAGGGLAQETTAGHSRPIMVLPGFAARRSFGPTTLPPDMYFVLGDNRDNSKDSRYFGPVSRDQIVGRAKGVFVSADPARWLRPRFERFWSPLL